MKNEDPEGPYFLGVTHYSYGEVEGEVISTTATYIKKYVISLGDWGGWVIVVECAYASSGKVPKNDYKTTLIDPNFKDKQEYSGFK